MLYPTPLKPVSRDKNESKWYSSASLQSIKYTTHPDDNRVLYALGATEIGYLVYLRVGLAHLQGPKSSFY